jgi:hypothetical protein
MTTKNRLVLTQKQLSVAVRALKDIRDNGTVWPVAESALDEIERIALVQKGTNHAD